MPRHTSSPLQARHTAGTVLKGLLALVVMAGLLIGIPLALVMISGNPLPDSAPSWSGLISALTEPDDGSLFLRALLWIAWLGWASFAIGLLVEIPAALRGRVAPRIPILRVQQRAAAGLVSAVAALFVIGPAGVAMAAEAPQPEIRPQESSVLTQPATDQLASADSNAESTTATTSVAEKAAPAQRTHVVQKGESLWKIAEKELGDGARWPEVAELNYGIRQPDGKALDDTHWIDPGWRLLLPADPADDAPGETASDEHLVVKGDTLWDIAEEKLGDGARYPELFEASQDTIQPDGRQLRDPDLIIPGWTITVPVPDAQVPPVAEPPSVDPPVDSPPAAPVEEPPVSEEPPVVEEPAQSPVEEEPTAEQSSPVAEAPAEQPQAEQPPAEQSPPAAEQPPAEEPPADEPPVQQPHDELPPAEQPPPDAGSPGAGDPAPATALDGGENFPVRTVAGIGSLLAAGVLAYLAVKRRTQQRRRRPGERIAMPDGVAASTERELRTVADPLSVHAVDQALRGLAHSCADRGLPLPPVRLARLTADQLELYLTGPAELPAPFVATEEAHVWFLPAAAWAAHQPVDTAAVAAPYPSLVTIGHGPENGHLLLHLERLGTLALVGDQRQSQEVAAALAVELATSPWADDLQVTLVGLCPELADGLDTGRVRYLPSVGTLLDQLSRRADQDRTALAASGAPSLDEARLKGVATAAWTPEIVLLGTPLDDQQADRLAALVDALPRVAVAAVTSGSPAVGEWALELNSVTPAAAMLRPIGVQVNPQRLNREQYSRILKLLGIAEEPGSRVWDDRSAELRIADIPVGDDPDIDSLAEELNRHPDEPAPQRSLVSLDEAILAGDDLDGRDLAPQITQNGKPGSNQTPEPDQTEGISQAQSQARETSQAPARQTSQPDQPDTSTGELNSAEIMASASATQQVEAGPTVLLLGPVDVDGATGPVEQSKHRQLTEIAAYIALHPGLDHLSLDEAIWPGNPVTQNTRNTAISKLRRWLGRDSSGNDFLPRVDTGYHFHPGVTTDWDTWTALVGDDPHTASIDQLTSALELVRGQPFTGVSPRRYAWAEHLKQDMISAIVDAAHELASRALKSRDAHLARRAATIGLQVEPGMELLWRDRIMAEHLAGNRSGIEDAVARMTAISDDLGDELEEATVELIHELLPSRAKFRADSSPELSSAR